MERKTCMCGYSTDKSNKWDDDLDQCKKCTKEQNKKMQKLEEIQDYLDTFEVGDLVCWRNRLHVLVETKHLSWTGRYVETTRPHHHQGPQYVCKELVNLRRLPKLTRDYMQVDRN